MRFVPHDYQRYCITRIIQEEALALFLDMGLGKTVITLTAVCDLIFNRFLVSRCLVIAPKKVAEDTWTREQDKWDHLRLLKVQPVLGAKEKRIRALNSPGNIFVINRENVPWLVDHYRNDWPFDMVVIDESSSFKSHQAKRFRALKNIRRHIRRLVELTAPISGTVNKKNAKEGDNINAAYNSSLAVIYDLSKVKFKMQIDELDVLKISVGQEVSVRADALEGVEMTGHITNISLEANTSGGVTEYPVTVELDEVGDLLPGMNVSATIVLKEEKDALCIPVDALMRGDVVYMKNGEGEETTPEELAAGVPEGFHEVKVTVGISSDSYVQILSGLKPEDEVYVPRAEMTDMYGLMMGTDDYYYEEEEDVE